MLQCQRHFFSRALCHRKFATIGVNVYFFLAQMTSCAVRYHVIYHSFRINSEHLKTWRVDSHVTEWRSKLEQELETCKRKMLAIQRGYMPGIMIICRKPTIFSWGLNCCKKRFWRSWPLKREFSHSMIYSNKLTFISWCFITIENAEVKAVAWPILKRAVSSFWRLQQTFVTSFQHDFLLKSRNLGLTKFANCIGLHFREIKY